MSRLFSVVLVLLACGCAASGMSYQEHLASAAAVPPASARLVVFRTRDSMQYSGRAAALKLDGNALGSCEHGGFSVFDVAPGKHTLTVDMWDSPGTCDLPIDAAAGKRSYFHVRPRGGNLAGALTGGLIGAAIESGLAGQCGGAFSITLVPEEFAAVRLADLRMSEASVSPVAAVAPAAAPAAAPLSVEQRLRELKRLREAGLITEDVYQDQQRRALGLR